ncbi:MAG TPA: hypothetical protein DCW88_08870 [Agrobacterium sp.]|nr:hypothetical protein EGT36_15445 [Agrobacterium sp. FDAARGOS_525]HAU75629.1 hypothetical protein [Agrobacterium sp.]
MLARSTPELPAVCPPGDSTEFVSADYNVCVTVTCHRRQAGVFRAEIVPERVNAKRKPFAEKGQS